jgi:hypothetical protein
MSRTKTVIPPDQPFLFGTGFLHDHLGQIIDDPSVAIVELVANAYDAGAESVDIIWPELPGQVLSVTDNGTGMSRTDFEKRWKTLAYDRITEQGAEVTFPPDVAKLKRTAFGHNGKGRFSPFCFSDEYRVETWKDGKCTCALVRATSGGSAPFSWQVESETPKRGHGTRVHTIAQRRILSPNHVSELIGFKFAVDPAFVVKVNGLPVKLLDLTRLATHSLEVEGCGRVLIHRLDPQKQERTMRLKGIAWWVNRRMVGEPSWEGLDGPGQYLDGRTSEAKRFSFVVEADFLKDETKSDWSGFKDSSTVDFVKKAVHNFVSQELRTLLASDRRAIKKAAIEPHRQLIKQLPSVSQRQIGQFVDAVQERCPTFTARELSRTVEIWANLERSRTGYDLLEKLAACSPDDLDTWNSLMNSWDAKNAEIVLNELDRRLKVIQELHELIRDKKADELHQLQPLFERGLWIFGPEYEAIGFTSNRSMATVVREFFGKRGVVASNRRADFIALPDSSIGLSPADEFTDGEVSGIRKILIVELKRGGFVLTQKEVDQTRDYAKELQSTGCAQPFTQIEAFVLGASLEQGLRELKHGDNVVVKPVPYDIILNRAHARVCDLHRQLREATVNLPADSEVNDVLEEGSLEDSFATVASRESIN